MTSRIALAGAAGLLLGSFSLQAAETGWYAGLSLGRADYDLDDVPAVNDPPSLVYRSSSDSKDFGFGVFGGYQWNRWLALEGSFNHFGTATNDFSFSYSTPLETLQGSGNGELEARAFSVSALFTIPLGESFSFGLRAGGAYARLESEGSQTFRFNGGPAEAVRSNGSDSGFKPTYGANLQYAATRAISIRLDWQTFEDVGDRAAPGFDGIDLDLMTLSVIGRF